MEFVYSSRFGGHCFCVRIFEISASYCTFIPGVFIAENCQKEWILSSSAGRTIFHLSPKYLMRRIMLPPLKVYTVDPSEVRRSNETTTLISESSLLKHL